MSSSSGAASHGGSSTSTRDYLFRALYLRREMLLLSTHGTGADAADASAESSSSDGVLHDVLLLPPLYGLDGLAMAPASSDAPANAGGAAGTDPMLTRDHAWNGLVHVRASASPWYRGCFAFYVYFPSRYPFEPPIIELAGPLRSHPLVQERRVQHLEQLSAAPENAADATSRLAPPSSSATNTSMAGRSAAAAGKRVFVPFEEVYAGVDPMRVSVMTVLLRHMQRVFLPSEWSALSRPAAALTVNRVLARRDVERRSVTQEVLLLKPFEQYVGTEVMQHFVGVWEESEAGACEDATDTVAGDGADWYTREVLPHLLHS